MAAIVERLAAIEKVFNQYATAISSAQERDRELKARPENVRAEVTFDDATKRDTQAEANRQYTTQNSIRRAAWAASLAAILYAGISLNQLNEMHVQTGEIFHQSQVENASASVKAVETFQQLKIAQDQAMAAQQQARATQANVTAIQRQFQQDQRPYIGITGTVLIDYETGKTISAPVIGKPFGISVLFTNVGKSPALNLAVHRHLLFGENISEFRVEPADTDKSGDILDIGIGDYTTAISVKDTYSVETIQINQSDLLNWDGSEPIIVFGRITYSDRFGHLYCKPYGKRLLQGGNWANMRTVRDQSIKKLCPVGDQN